MARLQTETFDRESSPSERKEEDSDVTEERSSASDQEQNEECEAFQDSASQDSAEKTAKHKQSYSERSENLATLSNMGEHMHLHKYIDAEHPANFNEGQPHIHEPIYLRHGEHLYAHYPHLIAEQDNVEMDLRSPTMKNHYEIQHTVHETMASVAHQHMQDRGNHCVEDPQFSHIHHQYSITDSEGVTHLIPIPNHHSSMLNTENPDPIEENNHHDVNDCDPSPHIRQVNHNSSPHGSEGNESHTQNMNKKPDESEMARHHVLQQQTMDECNDLNGNTHLVHLQPPGEQDNIDVESHTSRTHMLHSATNLESDLHHMDHNQDDGHHQASSLIHDKDMPSQIIQHGTDLSHRLNLELPSASHINSFPHIRGPPSPRDFISDRLGYHINHLNTTLQSDYGRTLSNLNDNCDAPVDSLPLRSILTNSSINYLPSSPIVDPNSLHAVTTPSVTYHHLPEGNDSSATTSSPLFCPGANTSTTSSKLLGLSPYGRSHDNNNVGSLMWGQIGEDVGQKQLSIPVSNMLSRTNSSGHVSSYVPDLGVWNGYDGSQNVQMQLSHSSGGKCVLNPFLPHCVPLQFYPRKCYQN